MKLKTIIVDDELNSIETTTLIIKNFCKNDIEIIGSFSSSLVALEKIKKLNPDLVLLDIEMPQLNGFELLTKLDSFSFNVIFLTAFSQYAIKAIKFSAIDYLLKPLDGTELIAALARIKKKKKSVVPLQVNQAMLNYQFLNSISPSKIVFNTGDGIEVVAIDDILYIKSEGNYSTVYNLDNKPIVTVIKPLKDCEEMLFDRGFFRTHNSYLISLKKIKKFVKNEGGALFLEGNIEIPISRAKKEELLQMLKNHL